jgi:hypothetical protein
MFFFIYRKVASWAGIPDPHSILADLEVSLAGSILALERKCCRKVRRGEKLLSLAVSVSPIRERVNGTNAQISVPCGTFQQLITIRHLTLV